MTHWLFLLTPLREGRRSVPVISAIIRQFLLTPLREGRPAVAITPALQTCISTHAPAGGATVLRRLGLSVLQLISTHAPAGGATPLACAFS